MRLRSLIAAGITLLVFSGCASRKIPQKSKEPRKASPAKKTSPVRREITIAVVGDKKTRHSFRDGLLKAGCPGLLSTNSDSAKERAALIATADACLIVVNCSDGPMPVNREDIQLARQFCRGRVSIAFSWTHLVADPDLYELEEIEMRDLMNAYDLPGDTAPMFFDTQNAATRLPRGYAAAAKALRETRPADFDAIPIGGTQEKLRASISVLAAETAFRTGLVGPLRSGAHDLVFGKEIRRCQVHVDSEIRPGCTGDATVVIEESVREHKKGRFVVTKDGHVLAMGSVYVEKLPRKE